MTENRYAPRAVYKVTIKAPIETVWSELVNRTAPRPFFWNATWDAAAMAAGEPYRMLSKDKRTVPVIGRILSIDPPRRLETTFQLTALPDPPSKVIYTLTETTDGVEFSLITEEIVAGSKSEKSMADGSRFIVAEFKNCLETGKPSFGGGLMLSFYDLMGAMAPKSMRADNWPLGKA
jgi:uncharacterized protein YndB with AHSA1/START domain